MGDTDFLPYLPCPRVPLLLRTLSWGMESDSLQTRCRNRMNRGLSTVNQRLQVKQAIYCGNCPQPITGLMNVQKRTLWRLQMCSACPLTHSEVGSGSSKK